MQECEHKYQFQLGSSGCSIDTPPVCLLITFLKNIPLGLDCVLAFGSKVTEGNDRGCFQVTEAPKECSSSCTCPVGLMFVNWQGSEMNVSALSEVPREGFLSNAVSCQVSQTLPACNDGEKHLAARPLVVNIKLGGRDEDKCH